MEVHFHTTPAMRQELRQYLRNRRLVTSIHNTIMAHTLNDLEDALRLLRQGLDHPCAEWIDEVEAFLEQRTPAPAQDPAHALPGLLDGR